MTTMAIPKRLYPLRYHAQQDGYYNSEKRFNVVPAGRRSGKTEIAKRKVVRELFSAYLGDPLQMPPGFSGRAVMSAGHPAGVARAVADYIAGMTDRFAAREHERLTGRRLLA